MRQPCTCPGTCRGAGGLGEGWYCVSEFNQLCAAVGARVERMQRAFREECPDGVVRLPFRCYSCDERRMDFALLSGDGLPICEKCIGGCVDAMGGVTA